MNREGVEQFLNEFHTPIHVRAHCLQVARIGESMAQKLNEKGIKVDPEMVWIAGMIHDVVRVVDFKELSPDLGTVEDQKIWGMLRKEYAGKHHADAAAEILTERGEIELAEIVRRHKYSSITSEEPPETWEEKLLYYADKRVAHDQIVNLRERLEEGRKRHFPGERITKEEEERRTAIHKLEAEIFEKIDLNPGELLNQLIE